MDKFTIFDTALYLQYFQTACFTIKTQNVKCSSMNYKPAECEVDGVITDISVAVKHSQSACALGTGFGVTEDKLWVDKGCRATFKVEMLTNGTVLKERLICCFFVILLVLLIHVNINFKYKCFKCLVGWMCFTSNRKRGHLEMAPLFTVPCETPRSSVLHPTHRE